MTDLDLTKPLRLKDSKRRFYQPLVAPKVPMVEVYVRGLVQAAPDGEWLASAVPISYLENVPEPLARYIRVKLDIDSCCGASAWFGSLHHSLPPPEDNDPVLRGTTLLKLTRTEDGKTHVEVIDG